MLVSRILKARTTTLIAVMSVACSASARGQDAGTADFFERKIRPLLLKNCISCHGAEGKKHKGGLKLTNRDEMLKGGDSGPAIVVGKPEDSLLVRAVHYGDEKLRMPPDRKLAATEIADLSAWVKAGAPWPATNVKTPSDGGGSAVTNGANRDHWAFQPVKRPILVTDPMAGNATAIDRFLSAQRLRDGLPTVPPADRRTWLRRVTLDLTGLPPTMDEIDAYANDLRPDADSFVVDRLLASPRFGENQARRWLDLARYADSNGLDENTAFGNAYRYRDYVVSAFNRDRPFNEFLAEQIAGDLMPDSAVNPDRLTATGFLVVGPKVLAEPDKQKMKLDIADEQLDTIGRAMLGMTFGCARCHDHKFDPISRQEYYGLLSIFTSTRTMKNLATVAQAFERPLPTSESAEVRNRRESEIAAKQAELTRIETALKRRIFDDARIRTAQYLEQAAVYLRDRRPPRMDRADSSQSAARVVEAEQFGRGTADVDRETYGKKIGVILSLKPTNNSAEYEVTVDDAGEYDLEVRYAAQIARPVQLIVNGGSPIREIADRVTGGWDPNSQQWERAGRIQLRKGKNVIRLQAVKLFPHIDRFALFRSDAASSRASLPSKPSDDAKIVPDLVERWGKHVIDGSRQHAVWDFFHRCSIREDAWTKSAIAAEWNRAADRLPEEMRKAGVPESLAEACRRIAGYVDRNGVGEVKSPLLPTQDLPRSVEVFYPKESAELSKLGDALTTLKRSAPPTSTVLSVEDGPRYGEVTADGKPRSLFVQIRGNYLTPAEEAPSTFPEVMRIGHAAFGPSPGPSGDVPEPKPNQTRYGRSRPQSGRRELAQWITDPRHPLTARVYVNRLWQQLFGEGLVRSPDNFGLLGEKPTHPELLDHLASEFIDSGWSVKRMIRMMVLTDAYRLGSTFDATASEKDPENRRWWRMNRKRMTAESLRDSLLSVGGNLQSTMGGSLLNNGNFTYVNNEFSTNTARYDNDRRSIYLPVIRNTLYDFFQAFDFAEPHVSNGKRSATITPAQSLYLMNNPLVRRQADGLVRTMAKESPGAGAAERVDGLFRRVYGRAARPAERSAAIRFVQSEPLTDDPLAPWRSLALVLLAGNEFLSID